VTTSQDEADTEANWNQSLLCLKGYRHRNDTAFVA
jgi:hypothetical protein